MECRLYDPVAPPECTTREWYAGRARAAHLESPVDGPRMVAAAALIERAWSEYGIETVSDLGAGDGGLLSLIDALPVATWGYDLQPTNVAGALERKVDVMLADVLTDPVHYGDLSVCTEFLEHLQDPHGFLTQLRSQFVVASSPRDETGTRHYEFHLWCWDEHGYAALLNQAGYQVLEHVTAGGFQIILGMRP